MKYADVHVSWDGQRESVDTEDARVYYRDEPRGVRIILDSMPPGAASVRLTWPGCQPLFRDQVFRFNTSPMEILLEQWMPQGPAKAKYCLEFLDSAGSVLHTLDPGVTGDPDSPGTGG
jgi:hypothetical protein